MRCGSLLFRHGAVWNIHSCVWPTASYVDITVHLQKTLELSTLSFRPGVGKNTAFSRALPTVTDTLGISVPFAGNPELSALSFGPGKSQNIALRVSLTAGHSASLTAALPAE